MKKWESSEYPENLTRTPKAIENIHNQAGDYWFTYDGELLFDSIEDTKRVKEKLERKARVDIDMDEVTTRTTIRKQDQDDLMDDLEDKYSKVSDERGGFLIELPAPEFIEKGEVKTIATINLNYGYKVSMGGPEYKIQQIMKELRKIEYYDYAKKVVDPVFEKYHEKYPYS